MAAALALAAIYPAILPAILGAQTPVQIHGTVRDSAGHAVSRAEVSVAGDSTVVTTNDAGAFAISTSRPRDVVVHVRRLGYEPKDKEVMFRDSAHVDVVIVLTPLAQSIATFRVVAKRTGVWGTVRTPWGVPIPAAQVQLLGTSAKPVVTDSAGEFTLPTQHSGTFLVIARKEGYAFAQTSVALAPDEGDEAEIILTPLSKANETASGFGRMQTAFAQTSTRIAFKTGRASVVTHDELEKNGNRVLAYALCGTSAEMRSGSRCPVRAQCVVINGDRSTALPLEAFEVDDVESVEFYPPGSDWSDTLRDRGCANSRRTSTAVVWLRDH
ncbi:MAG TPA: carboxypeptidase-like regulatory domain-containing protein [Gemmatimonadaceae bacterium]|nr:carboxypeptidase-like regulatory domain-containing protein [Gemmatimonadaceae bacterium]